MNVLLNGALGKMGNEVIEASKNCDDINIVCGFDRFENYDGAFPIYSDIEKINEKVDVIIDFSVPVATFKILDYAKNNHIPIVIATTGFSDEQLIKIKELSNDLPIFRSFNMSLDIILMVKLVQKIASVLRDSDIEIIETHHNRKVDSPSGTAILLADAINDVFNNEKKYNFSRMQNREKRSKNEIGFSSVRGGNIVGEHTVKFFSENETLEITHTSYSRQVFADGALKAARFIVNKNNGLYDMNNLVIE